MTICKKPILFNGYKINDELVVKNRIECIYFSEVYLLSDGSFLYLLLNIGVENKNNRHLRYQTIEILENKQKFLGVIAKEYSRSQLLAVIDDFMSTKGFDSIAGMEELKNTLLEEVVNPLKNPEKFKKFKVSIPNGIILYGPPGVGKTFIARKLAEELGCNYFEKKGSDLATPYIHGSVGNIGKAFDIAKQNAPSVMCFNEIDVLVPKRNIDSGASYKEEEVGEFLTQLEEAADHNVFVVGTTNYIEKIDEAIIRPGRFDLKFFIPFPDKESRKAIIVMGLSDRPYNKKIDFDYLAEVMEGLSCADIVEGVIEVAARKAVNLNMKEIDQKLILDAFKNLKRI